MVIEKIYLGTWFQRTSLHLKEVLKFLKDAKGVEGLEESKINELRKNFLVKQATFHEETDFDSVEALVCGDLRLTVTEDGVMLVEAQNKDLKKNLKRLESFYTNVYGPAIGYLFSRGAPIPKSLSDVKEVFPFLAVVRGASAAEVEELFRQMKDEAQSRLVSASVTIISGQQLSVISLPENYLLGADLEEFIRTLIFFREFQKQLKRYLNTHRNMWVKVSAIREANGMRFRDFPGVRQEISDFMRTLLFVKARLAQMGDILDERRIITKNELHQELHVLGLNRFVHLKADQRYISHLWNMTLEYTKGTLDMLDSLYQENTQRELNIIKFATLTAVMTGFFGMNIAFPWEERWIGIFPSSLAVTALIVFGSVALYFSLRAFHLSRHFVIKNHLDQE